MKTSQTSRPRASFGVLTILCFGFFATAAIGAEERFLYVAVPGIRAELQYGGHGILVFNMDHGHRFIRRIPTAGLDKKGQPLNVKGVCASVITKRLYISTTETLSCLDLLSEKVLWERPYEGGCDRMALAPDGKTMFLPSLEKGHWHLVDAMNGDVLKKIEPKSGAHNTIFGLNGEEAYLAGLKSPELTIVDTRTREVKGTVGPFGAFIRPFTVNGRQTLCFVNVNELLGFEIGDLKSGKFLHRIEVAGFSKGATKRHGCPCHGIGLTPDESEVWLADSFNRRLHIFDATVMPPKQKMSIALRDEPGWVTFSIDGQYAYPSTGDVIDPKTHKVLLGLRDEEGREVQSEKLLEIDFAGKDPVRAGDQFGLGRVR